MSKKKMLFSNSHGFLTSLVGYYPLNTNANDFSGNAYNGTQVGSPTYGTGKVGNAINFGNNNNLNYINIADNNDFSFKNGTTDVPFTISLWVNLTAYSNIGSWFINKRGNQNGLDEWQFVFAQSRVYFYKFQFNITSIYQEIGTSTGVLPLNIWTHLVYTDNGSGEVGSGKIYINGVLNTNINQNVGGTYTRMNNGTSITRIGINSWTPTQDFKVRGLIDELAIWKNRELTATEVLELYNKGNAGNPII